MKFYCIAQGTLLNVMWQPGWENSLGENGFMYMSLHCPPETVTMLLIGYTPIKNKVFFFKWRVQKLESNSSIRTSSNPLLSAEGGVRPPAACFHCSVVSDSLWAHGWHHASLPCPSPSPGTCWTSCSLCQWCHPTISYSVVPFSSCLLSFRASQSFPMSQLFTSGGQNIGASASASFLLMNIQGWFPLGFPVFISLQSNGLSRVFSSTTIWKHQFFGTQPSLWSNSHIHTCYILFISPQLWILVPI